MKIDETKMMKFDENRFLKLIKIRRKWLSHTSEINEVAGPQDRGGPATDRKERFDMWDVKSRARPQEEDSGGLKLPSHKKGGRFKDVLTIELGDLSEGTIEVGRTQE